MYKLNKFINYCFTYKTKYIMFIYKHNNNFNN